MKKKSGNKNIKKTLLKILLNTILVIVSIPIALTLLFQNPAIQTISARIATEIISINLDQKIQISSIKLGIFSGINLSGLKVYDHHNNVLLGVGKLKAMPVLSQFSTSSIIFTSVELDSAEFRMGTYKDEENSNLSLLISSLSSRDSTNTDSINSVFSIKSNRIILKSSTFNLFNENRDYNTSPKAMDYANILITDINSTIKSFHLVNDSINLTIKKLRANESSGLVIKKMSADYTICSSSMIINNGLIDINNSKLDVDFRMDYRNFSTLSYYIDSVEMSGTVRPTTIDMADIGHFADILYQMPNVVGITGYFNGTVKKLSGSNLKIKYGDNTRLSGNVSIEGLPDFFTSYIIAKDLLITSNADDIKSFYLPIESKFIDLSDILPASEQVTVLTDFKGYYENFTSSAKITINNQTVKSSIDFKTKGKTTSFTTNLKTDSLNIGQIFNLSNIVGNSSFDIKINGVGNTLETMRYNASGKLKNTQILDYNYSLIGFNGSYFNDSIIANLRVGDKNLMMEASGKANIGQHATFDLSSNIVKANLNDLNLWLNQDIQITSKIDAKVLGKDINTLKANIALRNNLIKFGNEEYDIDSILITKETNNYNYTKTTVSSDVIDLNAEGSYFLTTVANSFISFVNSYYDITTNQPDNVITSDSIIDFSINIHKPDIFTKQLFKGLTVSPETSLKGNVNFKSKDITASLSSSRILLNDIRLDTNLLSIYTDSNYLFSEFSIANLILKDSTPEDSIMLGIDNFSVSSRIGYDSLVYGINWYNRNQNIRNSGALEGYISKNSDTSNFSISEADVFINDVLWSIDTTNMITFIDNRAFFKNFYITAGNSEFKLLGTIPREENDSLVAEFVDWDLSNFDLLTLPLNLTLDGKTNGQLKLTLIEDNPTLVSNINIKNLNLNNEYLGDASILNSWNNTAKSIFIKSEIIRHGNVGSGKIFHAEGYYQPFEKEDNIKIDVSFDKFKLNTFEPFLSSFVKEMEGTTSGELEVRGSIKKPIVTGYADMQRTSMRVVYLNTKYSFSNSIEFIKNGLRFDKLVIYDTLGNQAQINGKLTYDYVSDPEFNVDIVTDGLLFFNTSQNMNDLYYGSAIASGKIHISGTPKDVDLDINVKTQRGTSVILPLNYSVEISDKDYIIFTKKEIDTISENNLLEITSNKNNDRLRYDIGVNLEVTPNAEVGIRLPDDMGNITARGTSNLALDVNSEGKFSLVGDYIVNNGIFLFKIGNLVSKRFELVSGGRISWSGNPYSAQVNIRGLYKVKTSLSSLGITIDSTASYKNKVTVECYIVLTDELLNPNIKFEIKIPSLDPDFQRAVFSELDTTNTAMMNQQMISLLVLGTFSFNNAANVSLQSSYYNVIANQLSSMLSQISDNVDIGLNYKPGDNVSQEEFEVALSTQLFDDRLTIDGNFGMTYDRTDQSASNIIGDVDIGYKLTPDGRWVLKVFNHSNVNSWYNYNNYDQTSPYTQGVGIAFRKDFDNIKGLFQSIKKKNKKKDDSIPTNEDPDPGQATSNEEE